MLELLRAEPGLFLDEIRERLYDDSGTLIGITSVHRNLVEKMSITLKKADTVNIKKSLVAKYAYIDRLVGVPAEQIVFTGKQAAGHAKPSSFLIIGQLTFLCDFYAVRVHQTSLPSSNVFPIQKRYGRHPTSSGAEPKELHTHSGDQHVWRHCTHRNRTKCQATLLHTLPKISAGECNHVRHMFTHS
jgi:hypothetical protein